MLDKKNLRIVFLGTPDFAVATLDALIKNDFNVVGVITAPDRRGGRGMKTKIESAVKKYAQSLNLPILQPTNLKNQEFQSELRALRADIQIVVAFRMLPMAVWDMPPLGTYNLHASLLPKYRGAAPIHWAIIRGESYSGITTFKLKHAIDTGSIALQKRIEIAPGDYLNDVHDRLMTEGADLIIRTLDAVLKSELALIEQNESGVTKAPKIFHDDCKVDFNRDTWSVYNQIRGLSPFPVAWTTFDDQKLKIYRATYAEHRHKLAPGTMLTDKKTYLAIATNDGLIFMNVIQLQGKKKMSVKDFLNGLQIKENNLSFLLRSESPWSS